MLGLGCIRKGAQPALTAGLLANAEVRASGTAQDSPAQGLVLLCQAASHHSSCGLVEGGGEGEAFFCCTPRMPHLEGCRFVWWKFGRAERCVQAQQAGSLRLSLPLTLLDGSGGQAGCSPFVEEFRFRYA